MNTVQRIKEFIDNQGISIRAFEQKISASNGLIRKAIMNNTDIQGKWLSLIVDNYPHLNTEWLLTGRGSMLKSNGTITNNQSIKGNSNNMIGGNGAISVDDNDSKQSSAIIAEYNERLKKQEEYIQSLLEEQKSLHQQISKLIDKLK